MNAYVRGQLTVYFDCPFWVAVFEKECDGKLQTCRVVLGTSEPKDNEIYHFVLQNYYNLKFSKAIKVDKSTIEQIKNPKRMQRDIKKAISQSGTSTKSQEAIRIAREQNKLERKKTNKIEKQELEKEKYHKKQNKKKSKKRGH